MSAVVPSPQFTVIPVTAAVLVTLNVTVTAWPVVAGNGAGAFTVTVGALTGAWTTTEPVP